MASPTIKPLNRWLLNSVIAIGTFIVIDLVAHLFWPASKPYMENLPEKLLYTTVFAAIYAHIYDKASQEFHLSKSKILNGLVFSLLFCVIIIMMVGLLVWVGAVIFIDILQGFRGGPPPPETRDVAVVGVQTLAAGTTVSWLGKTEDNPR